MILLDDFNVLLDDFIVKNYLMNINFATKFKQP